MLERCQICFGINCQAAIRDKPGWAGREGFWTPRRPLSTHAVEMASHERNDFSGSALVELTFGVFQTAVQARRHEAGVGSHEFSRSLKDGVAPPDAKNANTNVEE